MKRRSFILGGALAFSVVAAPGLAQTPVAISKASPVREARIARWKDDKAGAFCLMFDDSIPSDVANVFPELKKRNLVGTFYVNPGGYGWQKNREAWEKEMPANPNVVYANHTMTHKGARSVEELTKELKDCNDVIYKLMPGKQPRLVSFGRPGVKPEEWTVSEADLKAQLKQQNLIERPPFGDHGAMIGPKTAEQMVQFADRAIEKQSLEFVVFHGVGGDWIVTPTPIFVEFLNLLSTRTSKLWITDHLSAYKYEQERDTATVKVLSADARQLKLSLQSTADPLLFDAPLTLTCRVPDKWQECDVVQGSRTTKRTVKEPGILQFDAMPGKDIILVRPAKKTP
jgi:hypothetical protein